MTEARTLRSGLIDGGVDIGAAIYFSVALVAGAVIALQIAIMRLFAVGNWVHFGSMVVSLAMFGFGLASAVMCIRTPAFERHWRGAAAVTLLALGPLIVACNAAAQHLPFNAIFLVSDPAQGWRLAANFVLYFLPFLAAAFFLGIVFLKSRTKFSRVYFADLTGSGLCGFVMLGAMYVFSPETIIAVPLILWAAGGILWFMGQRAPRLVALFALVASVTIAAQYLLPRLFDVSTLTVSDYKGVSYARKFPDRTLIHRDLSPFGDLEVYASSYFHIAPGLSDNAAFDLPEIPANAYLGLYNDGDGPNGIIRKLADADTAYFRFLPMYYPYVLKQAPDTFVVHLSGGISTAVALRSGSKSVTVAESNPAIRHAFQVPEIKRFTGDLLSEPHLTLVPQEGRIYLAHTDERFDIIDLSLADSVGLSNPGGFAVVEKYAYTGEAMLAYMRALRDGGILSVTLWNKEDPPKSVLKLYATMVDAARGLDERGIARAFYVSSSYLSTTTVLYKRGGFSDDEIAKLRKFSRSLSFDDVYYPGIPFDAARADATLAAYDEQIFGDGEAQPGAPGSPDPTAPPEDGAADPTSEPVEDQPAASGSGDVVPAIFMGRIAWLALIEGGWDEMARRYVFDTRPLTNDRPYFAAYVKPGDLPRITDRLELFQDDWGYLLLWATLGIACALGLVLVLLPAVFDWAGIATGGIAMVGTIFYFGGLGAGYIMTEVGLISKLVLALSNATISASILLAGILVFSGLGSMVSERLLPRVRRSAPLVLATIVILLVIYSLVADPVLDAIAGVPYGLRLVLCLLLVAPPAFCMGFPMPLAMTSLGRLGKDRLFIWAWGINGCASVIGASAVPIVATAFGSSAVLQLSALAYLLAIPAFFALMGSRVMPLSRAA